LHELAQNAKATMGQMAKRTGIPTTTIHNRINAWRRRHHQELHPGTGPRKARQGEITALIFISVDHKADPAPSCEETPE